MSREKEKSRGKEKQPQQPADEFRYLSEVKLLGQDTTVQSKVSVSKQGRGRL